MWGKRSEQPRIQKLRRAARSALGSSGPLRTNISLELVIHVNKGNLSSVGDLDNFVTGVCDGLMVANGARWQNHRHGEPEWDGIQPGETSAIEDDGQVVSITARKVADATGEPWYTVTLEGDC